MLKRAVVTGAGGRVGRAIAVALADAGLDVCVHFDRSREGAEHTRRLCEEAGGQAWTFCADLSTRTGCAALIEAVNTRWSGLDVLVNNASVFAPVSFEAIGEADWDRMMHVNLRAPFLLSQGLLQGLRSRTGLVVHLCDIGGERPLRGYTPYSVSKAGLMMLVKSMAVELAPQVRTVGISPGQVIWPDNYSAELQARLCERIPMARVGTPTDVAKLVRFFVFDAPYINGQIVAVDGGLSVRY